MFGLSVSGVDKLALPAIIDSVRAVHNNAVPESSPEHEQARFIMGQLGPLWYRGYFADQRNFPTATSPDIDVIRQHFDVRHLLVGHTTVPTVTALYEGRVIAVQVYPERHAATGKPKMEALRIENDRFLRANVDGTTSVLFQ